MARRHEVLFRMGVRNAMRRKAQTLIVVAGLMVGTAIISGSLASGDSLSFGIRKAAYDALGPADVLLQVDGGLHYPRTLYDDLRRNATVQQRVVGLSPLLYEETAVQKPANKQSEPQVSLIGFEPDANRAFGTFVTTDGRVVDGSDLGPREAYVLDSLAAKLDARPGDALTLHYAKPVPPRIPRLYLFNGSFTASAGACPTPQLPQLCQYVAPPGEPATFPVEVREGAVSMTLVTFAFGPSAQNADLDQVVRAPDGRVFANANGTPAQPDNPSVLNVSYGEREKLPAGNWTWEVRSKAAANQAFRALALVFYDEYNLTALQDYARQAEEAGFDPEEFAQQAGFGGAGPGGESADITVKAIVTKEGFGDFFLNENVFMLYDSVAELYGQEGKVNLILASADADPVAGPAKTAPLMETLPRAVNASADDNPDEPALRSVKAYAIKQRFLDTAERAGTLFKQFLTTIGSFTVIAGIMLIVNIFVMLAEERKSELGMARAVGLTRRQLVYLFSFEGLLYALVASLLGALLGLLIAAGLITGFNSIFQSGGDHGGPPFELPLRFEASSVVWAFAAGFLITMATVLVASVRVSRLNIVRAIRRQEDPPRRAGRALLVTGAVLLVGGGAWALYGLVANDFVARILGPSFGLMGAGLFASRFVHPKVAYPLTGAAVAAYSGWTIFTLGNPEGLINAVMGPIRGVFIVLAVVLILIHLPMIVTLTSALLLRIPGLVPAVRPGVAYPLGKKLRTGLTTTMFALVILVVFAFSIFGATFTIDWREQSGGYDVEGDTTVPIEDLEAEYAARGDRTLPDPFDRIESHDDLRRAFAFGGNLVKINGEKPNYQGGQFDEFYSYNEGFARNNRYDFVELSPEYATPEDAYRAVLQDSSLVIVSLMYTFDANGNPGLYGAGDTLTLEGNTGTATFTIIGVQKQMYLGGIWVHPDVLDANFQRIRGEYLFKLKPGEDAVVAAREIEAAFTASGMDAESIEREAQQELQQQKQFLTLFQLFLGFGLVVGIASLGIVTARSVIERRQEIGMLRAIGYPRKQILRMFLIEVFFTTTLGVLIGGAIGIFTAYGVFVSTPQLAALGVEFRVPWLDLARITALVLLAVFLATYWPARQGSNVPPAEAVRYVE